jgi:arylsulfatase A-like enzyme
MVRRLRVVLVAFLVLAALLAAAAPALAVHRPTRVMIVVMDQMKPEYAEQFNMTNLLWLQKNGVNFPNAIVGHMASTTVISHNVMVSGQLPKHMGWPDEIFRDGDNILGYGENALVGAGDLGYADYVKLIENMDYPKIGDYLHAKYPEKIVACVGIKPYQVESMAASSADYWVRIGSSKAFDPLVPEVTGKWRTAGGNVPTYIATDTRFRVSTGNAWNTYGTELSSPSWLSPEDGRTSPGTVPGHEGGDAWVADATTAIMENEDWSGIFVNFPDIDKVGHMWGGGTVDTIAKYGWDPLSIFDQIHMPFTAKHADDQLGKLIAKLKELGQFEDTLIVVTADHGASYGENFYGATTYKSASNNWYAGSWYPGYGSDPHVPNTYPGPPALKPLLDTGNVAFSMQSGFISTFLIDRSTLKKREAAAVMATLPGVIATYIRYGDRYKLDSSSSSMTSAERSWWMAHGQELVDTMCSTSSAEVIGLFADKVAYGMYADHGGAQMDDQRIPMAWYMPGMKHRVSKESLRLVDIMPTMLEAMGIKATDTMDGMAYSLKLPK